MNSSLIAALVFLLIFLLLVVITQLIHIWGGVPADKSRKFLHVAGGALTLFFPAYLHSHWYVLGLCMAAFMFLCFTYYRKLLSSVHEITRSSVGSIIFPLPVYICFLVAEKTGDNMLLFYLPVSLLTISDTMAELGGRKWGHRSIMFFNKQKTVAGSSCFAISALVLSIIFIVFVFKIDVQTSWLLIAAVTIVSTVAELFSLRGYDNLTVPLSTLLVLYLLT